MKLSMLLFTVIGMSVASANIARADGEKFECKDIVDSRVVKLAKCDPTKTTCPKVEPKPAEGSADTTL